MTDLPAIPADLPDSHDELVKLIPYAKTILSAYKWSKRERMKRFFRSLAAGARELGEAQRARLEANLESKEGRELIGDYMDTVLRTSSKTAAAALAILYSDVDDEVFPRDFKNAACLALDGISDNLVNYFLALISTLSSTKAAEGPYKVYPMPEIPGFTRAEGIPAVHRLVSRGILLPDFTTGRFSGTTPIGVNDASLRFNQLLVRARRLLDVDEPAEGPAA